MNSEHEQVAKKKYEPPRVASISLRPEEAVLGHCKTASGGGNSTPGSCFPIGICNSVGS